MANTRGLQGEGTASRIADVSYNGWEEGAQSDGASDEKSELLRLITDRSPVLIAYIGADRRYKFVNKSYAERFGLRPEEVVGKSMRELLGEENFEIVEPRVHAVLRGERVEFEMKAFYQASEKYLCVIYEPEFGGHRQVVGFVATVLDITERKRAEEKLSMEKRFSDRIVDSLPGMFYLVSEEQRLLRWNKNLEQVSGYSGEEISRMTSLDFIYDEDKPLVAERIDVVFATGEATVEADFVTKAGERIPYFFTGKLIEFDGNPCLVGMGIDVTLRQQAEIAQSYLASIVESSEDAIIAVSLDGYITSWNSGAERLYGYTAAEIVGRPVTILMPPGSVDADKVPEVLARIRKGERVQQHEALRMAKWGKPVSVSLTVSPIKDKQGAIIGAAKIVRDITEKKRAEDSVRESEERLRLALDAGQVGIWDWDILRSHITWSDTICRFFGLRSGEFSGRFEDFLAYLHPDDRERVGAAINHSLQSGDPYSIEMRVIWPDGTERWISTNGGVYFDAQGNAMRMNGASVDITERKGAEELLKTADRRKDEFLAMLAHELRNPLAPIRNAVQALNRISPPEPQQQRLREMIDRQVAHLARLVDDLLDVSRITRNKITLRKERLDLATAVRHAVETSRPLLDARKQHLTVNFPRDSARPLPPLLVEGDMVRLAQVISNLLNNSAKYTPEGGNISLTAERDGDEITIRVKDDGIGISPKVLPYVFDLFTQADRSPDRSQGGLGIGLTLVRLLVGMHGGGVEAHSEGQGLGSEFVVRLPAAQDAGPEDRTKAPPVAADNHSSRRFRILVVDDNVDAAETMAMLLEIGGHEVKTAHDGPAAVQAACDFRPHAVLLDIGLPGIDGYEVARRLRHLDETKETFLIAVTGYGKTEDRVKALTTGFNYHITKPVDPAELEIIIKNLKPTRAD